MQSRIGGTGSYLPDRKLTNLELEKSVDTTDSWIRERTGIESRHINAPDQATSDLALIAATRALEAARLTGKDLDAIVVATVTPDQPVPSVACLLQHKLGCRNIMAFDIAAACSGFLYALSLANQMIQSGTHKHILVIGAESLSRITDYTDRGSCILFGDGAGAVILSRREGSEISEVLSSTASSDGSEYDLLHVKAGGSRLPASTTTVAEGEHFLRMLGKEVYKSAVRTLGQGCHTVLDHAHLKATDVDHFLFHQANLRIIESVAKQLNVPAEKLLVNIQDTGNTSSASVPILLDQNVRNGKIKRDQILLLSAFGAGLTSATVLLRY